MLIKVIAGPEETWPFSWYLRGFSRVGYSKEPYQAGDLVDVPVIISSPDQGEKIEPRLLDMFISEYYELRPGTSLRLSVRQDLWKKFLRRKNRLP